MLVMSSLIKVEKDRYGECVCQRPGVFMVERERKSRVGRVLVLSTILHADVHEEAFKFGEDLMVITGSNNMVKCSTFFCHTYSKTLLVLI